MSVSATENDVPSFFVGGEDGDELLDRIAPQFDSFYEHEDEYDSVCAMFNNV